ncbi:MAG: aspartate dehydrogenase [Actinomycetota bacterium]
MASATRVVMVGWGAIGRTAGRLLATHHHEVEIVGVAVTTPSIARDGVPDTARLIGDPSELAALAPTVVAEAAGRTSVAPWGRAALAGGSDLIVSSVSAFADPALLAELRSVAAASGRAIQIQPGALAGVDALAAARLLGLDSVEHRIVKPPAAWRDTPADVDGALDGLSEPTVLLDASAADTADRFPKNANVAMTTALAGLGPDATRVVLVADPAAVTNRHELRASGAFGSLDIRIDNAPLADNPKSSAMAALGLARSIANRSTTLAI